MARRKSGRRQPVKADRRILLLLATVACTILFVGKKVELDNMARQLEQVEGRLQVLNDEQARLTAAIVFKQKPGAIEQIARGRLDMVYSSGRLSDVTFSSHRGALAE
jgi:cell division protein FtsB